MTDVDPAISKIFDMFKNGPLSQHAQAIGNLCIAWSWLEMSVDALLCVLMEMDTDNAAAAVVYNMDFREKLKAVLALGYLRKPSAEWYAALEKTVNHADNNLRPERNRMIHDPWVPTSEGAFRVTVYAKVANEQARKRVLRFGTGEPITAANIYTLAIKILVAQGQILSHIGEYDNAHHTSPDTDA